MFSPSRPQFVPCTDDEVVVAIKSEEIAETNFQTSYITVFTLSGEVLLDEYEVSESTARIANYHAHNMGEWVTVRSLLHRVISFDLFVEVLIKL